jgi:hypothetical protein
MGRLLSKGKGLEGKEYLNPRFGKRKDRRLYKREEKIYVALCNLLGL